MPYACSRLAAGHRCGHAPATQKPHAGNAAALISAPLLTRQQHARTEHAQNDCAPEGVPGGHAICLQQAIAASMLSTHQGLVQVMQQLCLTQPL